VNKCFGHSSLCVCTYNWGSTVFYCKYCGNFLVCKHGLKNKVQEGFEAC